MQSQDDLSVLYETTYKDAVAKLEELMIQSGRAFLLGAGCSKCAGLPLSTELAPSILNNEGIAELPKTVLKDIEEQFAGTGEPNIEDFLSELVDLLAIADRRAARGSTKTGVDINGTSYTADQLRQVTEEIKIEISNLIEKPVNIETHRRFVKAVHRPVRPGKSSADQPVDYLVLNYDTLIEDALALEKLPFADGLEGGSTAWWNPLTFEKPGLAARVLKLHGSINWSELPDDPLPRRLPIVLGIPEMSARRIMIWPASTKYREAQKDPYVQLEGLARQVLTTGQGSQRVLLICGYRFGDSHINLELSRALQDSEGDLTIIAFSSDSELNGQLAEWHQDPAVRDRVLIYGKRGFFHGDRQIVSENDLPWWRFENVTRLLEGAKW